MRAARQQSRTRSGVSTAVRGLFAGGTVLCDGAMGTMLYGRGVFINRCYDELNVSMPDPVRSVHTEYLQAGAVIIETNTFGANAVRLERFGLERRVRELNLAGVRLARECVDADARQAGQRSLRRGSDRPAGRAPGPRLAKSSEGEA